MQLKRLSKSLTLFVCILLLVGILAGCAGTATTAVSVPSPEVAAVEETPVSPEKERVNSRSFDAVGDYPAVSWKEQEDGSYCFAMEASGENCQYAWQVLDGNNEPIIKTKYSEDSTFTCDLSDENVQSVKCFVRTYSGDDYEQVAYKIGKSEVLVPVLSVASTQVTEEAREILWELVYETQNEKGAKAILQGEYKGVPVALPMDWDCETVESRSTAVAINGFRFLYSIYYNWKTTHDPQYAAILQDYARDWLSQNPIVPGENPVIWHDDATARRVHRLALIYDEFKDNFTEEERKRFADSLAQQARLLMNPLFYTENHNHGMYQDLGVIAYALLVCEDEQEKQEMLAAAAGRTLSYFFSVFTEDGVHKEHSPQYAVYVVDVVLGMRKILRTNVPQFAEETEPLLTKARSYIVQCVQPDGILALVGDDTKGKPFPFAESLFYDSAEDEYITSHGQIGSRPADCAVYPQGGYAFFRSSWDDAPDAATWLMFIAATHSSTHKHGDDLSFLLYHKGDLFVEAGGRDYNYSDPYTFWAYSGYAHNVLLVDGQAFPVNVGTNGWQSILPEALKTHITDYDISSGDVYSVSGSCERFPGVVWDRSLEYDKAGGSVTVTDVVQAEEEKTGTLVYHIAEGVDVKETKTGWELSRDGDLLAVVSIKASGQTPTLHTYTGEGEDPYYTWIFNHNLEPAYGTVLTVDFAFDSRGAQIATEIQLS